MPFQIRLAAGLSAAGLLVLTSAAPAAPRRADLKPAAVAGLPAAAVQPGATLKLDLRVRNAGRRAARRTVTALFLSTDAKRDKGDTRLLAARTPRLKPRRSARLSRKVVVPAGLKPGTYRLIVCADLRRKVREKREGNNCKATAKRLTVVTLPGQPLTPPPPVQRPPSPPAPPVPPPADPPAPSLAFHVDDGHDYGYAKNAAGEDLDDGKVVTLSLRMAAGVPGAAGYERSTPADESFLGGSQTALTFAENDDAAANVALPFSVPFAGVPYGAASASTNGWLSFGDPAIDYWDDYQDTDFRGVNENVGQFARGVMPYWIDGDLAAQNARPAGTVKAVDPGDGQRFAVQWDINTHHGVATLPRRTMQATLFKDGRVRVDYAGDRTESSNANDRAFVGLSPGTGASALDALAINTRQPPATAVLYTPRAVSPSPAPAGKVTVTLPYGSTFDSADEGCTLVTAPTTRTDGLVECATPEIAAGSGAVRQVRYKQPETVLEPGKPAQTDATGRWTVAGQELVDFDELIPTDHYRAETLMAAVSYTGPDSPDAGEDLPFELQFSTSASSARRPVATITWPAGLRPKTTTVPGCPDLPAGFAGGSMECILPSYIGAITRSITFATSTAGSKQVRLDVDADNAEVASDTETVNVLVP